MLPLATVGLIGNKFRIEFYFARFCLEGFALFYLVVPAGPGFIVKLVTVEELPVGEGFPGGKLLFPFRSTVSKENEELFFSCRLLPGAKILMIPYIAPQFYYPRIASNIMTWPAAHLSSPGRSGKEASASAKATGSFCAPMG